jgi:hypothetical protein
MYFVIVKDKGECLMPQKLETVLKHVEEISNDVNRQIIYDYYKYLVSRDTSTKYQKDNIKLVHMFSKFLGESKTFTDVQDSETILAFLDTRRKSKKTQNKNGLQHGMTISGVSRCSIDVV